MSQSLLLGVDVSTTGAKALLIDQDGRVINSATTPLSLQTPHPLWSEQDPHEWWQGIRTSIRTALSDAAVSAEMIAGIGLTGQMHGLVLLDENGEVLRPAILWNDQRTGSQCDQIRSKIGAERLVQIAELESASGQGIVAGRRPVLLPFGSGGRALDRLP